MIEKEPPTSLNPNTNIHTFFSLSLVRFVDISPFMMVLCVILMTFMLDERSYDIEI